MNAEHLPEETEQEPMHQGMAAEHALLGLLALSAQGVGHGYELARHFEAGAALGNVIRLEPGMVYHHLKKLDRLGWVTALADEQGRPARRSFAISGAGRKELARWLAEPVAHTREIRLEFLVKLYFAALLDQSITARLVREQREICVRLIESLSEQRHGGHQEAEPDSPERRFGDMVLELRLAQTRAALAWLDSIQQGSPLAITGDASQH
jgi:DNA-binding PadR family transcriptional regulator